MNTVRPSRRDSVFTTLTNYLIVGGLLTCAVVGVLQLGLKIAPAWNVGYIPWLCFCVALESAYMTRYVRYGQLPAPWYVLRGVEVVTLFLITRSVLGLVRGPQSPPAVNPLYSAFDNELFALVIMVALVWLASWLLTSNLLNLEVIDPTLDREIIKDVAEAQVSSRQSLITFTAIIGVVLAFFAALIHTSPQPERAAPYSLWHVLVYFLLALILIGRTRLALLRAGWMWENVPIGRGVGGRWITYIVLLLIVALSVAVVLPTQYSLGLLGTLGYIFSLIVALIQVIVYVLTALIYALLSLFLPHVQRTSPPQMPAPLPFSAPETPSAAPPTISEFVQSLIFWIVFLVIAGYVAVQYLRRHPEIVEWLKHWPGMGLVVRLWHRVRGWFGGLNRQIEDLLEARRRARQSAPARSAEASRRFINPRKLSPRQQVQFFYLAMLRRSGERGHPRQATQTPDEYARRLQTQLPDVNEDILSITQEFSEARYSRHEISIEKVGLVRRAWEHIKRALKQPPP